MEKCKVCSSDAHPDSLFGLCVECQQAVAHMLFSPTLEDDDEGDEE